MLGVIPPQSIISHEKRRLHSAVVSPNRTAHRVASNERLGFGKLSAMVQVQLLRRLEVLRVNGHHLNPRSIASFRRQENHGGHAAIDGKIDNSSICSLSARYLAAPRIKG